MPELNKRLTLFGLTMVAIGSCIGSGIFLTPAQIAQDLNNSSLILFVWLIGGVVALTGALTFAELSGLFPKTGGVYVFLKEAYGNVVAFLYGWSVLLVVTSGAIAALCLAFAHYLSTLLPGVIGYEDWVASAAIILLSLVNSFGVHLSQLFSNVFTVLKLIGIALVILIGLGWGELSTSDIFSRGANSPSPALGGIFAALIGVLWSYGGWQHASYLGGEAINPSSTIPRAMIYGALIVTAVYTLTNLAYMYLLPLAEISASPKIAADAIATILPIGGVFIALLITISVLGTAGIYTLTAPRLYYAMAEDGLFFKRIAAIHPKYKTPVFAISLQAAWAIVLLFFWETFSNLITYVVFVDWIFMVLAAAAIYLFRKRLAGVDRPYKTWGYPFVPLVFILISMLFLVSTLIEKPEQAWSGLVLIAGGLPVYYYFKKRYLSRQN